MLQVFTAAVLLTLSANVGVAQGLPNFDIEGTCRAAQPLSPEDRDPYQGCMKDERVARTELQSGWAQFEAENRNTCVEETGIGGYPSYVEVLSCLQMFNGSPSSTLRPRRRGD